MILSNWCLSKGQWPAGTGSENCVTVNTYELGAFFLQKKTEGIEKFLLIFEELSNNKVMILILCTFRGKASRRQHFYSSK